MQTMKVIKGVKIVINGFYEFQRYQFNNKPLRFSAWGRAHILTWASQIDPPSEHFEGNVPASARVVVVRAPCCLRQITRKPK